MQQIPLSGNAFKFSSAIDLVDETLREGSERSSIAVDLEEKCELGRTLAAAGLRSLVVGMFPDVPHNIDLLKMLLQAQQRGEIDGAVRFLVISHVGETFRQTLRTLEMIGEPLDTVWIVAIQGVSDLQTRYVFPKILKKDPRVQWDAASWTEASAEERRRRSLEWFDGFLPELRQYSGGGIMVGLIDTFRADYEHVRANVALLATHGVTQIRLVDTAGTCTPQQVVPLVEPLVSAYPGISFYGHFHDDFGMASANALLALGCGARGVDVSVGGFANRAGHPALAEVAMSLRLLYGIELPGFEYRQLSELSRRVELVYGLIERASQPITGYITHSVQSGIRTELLGEARWVFDVIDPESVGSSLRRSFGVRSGTDGMRRILAEHAPRLEAVGIKVTDEAVDSIYEQVIDCWQARSNEVKAQLTDVIARYYNLLDRASFSEEEVLEFVMAHESVAAGGGVDSWGVGSRGLA